MIPVLLLRASLADAHERAVAEEHMHVIERRTLVPHGRLVVFRYSALPYNAELCADVMAMGGRLLNDARAHAYVADVQSWYADLEGHTPRSWFRLEDVPDAAFPVVVKGETNSRKDRWDTMMFAPDRRAMVDVALRLMDDSLLGSQRLVVRQYVPLRTHGTGLHGLPIAHEFRFFVLDGRVVTSGFYWSEHYDDLPDPKPSPDEVPRDWLQARIDSVKDAIRFFVMDVAQTQAGDWIVLELNDGSMSGLSMCDPEPLYAALGALTG